MLELVADRPAVGGPHPRQRLQQGLPGYADPQDRGGDAAHQLRGQVEVLGLKGGVAFGWRAERVEVGGEVAVGPVALEQRGRRLHRLQQLFVDLARGGGRFGTGRGGAERRCRGGSGMGLGDGAGVDADVPGDVLVEGVLALQELLDPAQEGARLRPLDHPVVVGGGQRHHLGDAELAQPFRRGVQPLGRVGDRAGGDDRALAAEQARDRGHRADAAGIGERDVGAEEVVGGELVLAGLRDQVFVVGVEGGEVEAVGALDRGDHQAVGAVLALDVDGDAEVDGAALNREGLALALLECPHHHREVFGRADDRPGHEVGEGDLQPALFEHRVDRLALGVQGVDGDRPERRRRRHRPALVHRLRQHRRRPPQLLRLAFSGRSGGPVPRRQHVLLGDSSTGPRPTHRAKVNARSVRYPARDRRGTHVRAVAADAGTRAVPGVRRGPC